MAEGGTPDNHDVIHFIDENYRDQCDEVLALQSIYEGVDDQRLHVLTSPEEDRHDLYTLHLSVPVQREPEVLRVDIVVPATAGDDAARPPDVGYGVTLSLSNPANKWVGSVTVRHLPALTLQVVLPPTYPSQSAPVFTLSCVWLTANQQSALCRHLDQLWKETQNLPVIFTWVDWLENDLISFLEIGECVSVTAGEKGVPDNRVQTCEDIRQAVSTVIQYNRHQEGAEFERGTHECHVCYDEHPGTEFFRIVECGHHFCRECMAAYCAHHVTTGTVEELRCPEGKCNSLIPPQIVQSVLPPGEYDRWERLLLQKTLEKMSDVEWCPRCNSPVIREEDDQHLAHCVTCYFSFCTECRYTWHQGEACATAEDKLADVEKKTKMATAVNKRKFEDLRRKLEEDVRTKISLQKKTKPCPRCKVKIEKSGGCNKMTCKCGRSFCWLCGCVINGYRHFLPGNSTCNLSDLTQFQPLVANITPQNVDLVQALVGTRFHEVVKCPNCRYRNVKSNRNNHIKCACCKTNFCCSCKMKIEGVVTSHFSRGECQQHS